MDRPPRKTFEYERPSKSTAKDVVDYEIYMMEHCAKRVLESEQPPNQLKPDELALLEAFLLHFRILLEFFGEPSKRFPDNIHFQKPPTCGIQPPPRTLAAVKSLAQSCENKWGEKLNKFLAHPTDRRHTTPRSWPVEEMRDEMRKLVAHWCGCWK